MTSVISQSGNMSNGILPIPKPFTLNYYDALQAEAFIQREMLLVIFTGKKRWTEKVNESQVVFHSVDPKMPPGHKARFDIVINGTPIDWKNTFMEYNGEMINLKLLFTYRNQRPLDDLLYRFP